MALIIYLQILLLLLFSSKITEILFLLRRKCPTANIYLFPILPQFDHLKTHFATTNSFIYFQVQEFFSEFFFSTSCHPPYIIKICTGLINSTSPQKAMKFLSGGLTTAWPFQPQPCSLEPNPLACPAPCRMFHLLLSSQMLTVPPPPPPTCSINSPTQLFLLHADTASKALLLYVHVHLHVTVPSQVLIPF